MTVPSYPPTAHPAPTIHINSIIIRPSPTHACLLLNVKPLSDTTPILIAMNAENARVHALIAKHKYYAPNAMQVPFYLKILVSVNAQTDILDIIINVKHVPINVKPVLKA